MTRETTAHEANREVEPSCERIKVDKRGDSRYTRTNLGAYAMLDIVIGPIDPVSKT